MNVITQNRSTLFISITFAFLCLLLLFPSHSDANSLIGVINIEGAAIRSGPGLNYSVIKNPIKSENFEVLHQESGWVKVKVDETEGWLTDSQIDIPSSAIVLSSKLAVYQQESTRSEIIGELNKNDAVTITRMINGWNQITSENLNGWVYGNLLKSSFKVSANEVNVYVDPSVRVSISGKLTKGFSGTISKEISGWYYFVSEAQSGWIYKSHLIEGSPKPNPVPDISTQETKAIILPQWITVYKDSSTRTPVLGKLPKNESVVIKKTINGWHQIQSDKFNNGWVYGGLLNKKFTVSATNMNIYQDASLRTPIIGRLTSKSVGEIQQEINGWYRISYGGNFGWVYYKHITEGSPAATVPTNIEEPGIVLKPGLEVYVQASTRTSIKGSLNKDDTVTIKQEINGWYLIESSNISGWVYGNLLNSSFTVSASVVNLYEKSTLYSNVIQTISKNCSGVILKEINGWYYIRTGEQEGWVYYKHLTDGSPAPVQIKIEDAIVIENTLNVYQNESTRTPIIGQLKKDDQVEILQEINGWYKIVSSELSGWVFGNLLKSDVTVGNVKVDVYLNSTTRSSILFELQHESKIKIVREINGWYNIISPLGHGWVYKEHLIKGSPDLPKLKGFITSDTQVYFEPTQTSFVLGSLNTGKEIFLTREVNGFYEIETNDIKGWVPAQNSKIMTKFTSLFGKTIVLDPGHGGVDSGAVGKAYGTKEKELNLLTALLLRNQLLEYGVNVVMTRTTDIFLSLQERVAVSHANNTDVFLSIHYNSAESSTAKGLETLYYHSKDIPLASSIQAALLSTTKLKDRGYRYQNLHVTRENKNPSALVELGFLSEATEELFVRTQEFREKAVNGIVEGLIKFFNN